MASATKSASNSARVDNATSRIVGRSPAIQHALEYVELFAPCNMSVLITGEPGVGKELFARRVHDLSLRSGRFVVVNCGAIPEALTESIFFGHVKGAFTGASSAHCGLFKTADGGTIFLDEIGELPLQMQVKLLRVLEYGEFSPVGSSAVENVDVRTVAATNRDLWTMIETREFREDLYWRVRGIEIPLPPLRERADDMLEIADALLAGKDGRGKTLSRESRRLLAAHRWSGNVRELRAELHAAVVLSRDESVIEPRHFPLNKRAGVSTGFVTMNEPETVTRPIVNLEAKSKIVEFQTETAAEVKTDDNDNDSDDEDNNTRHYFDCGPGPVPVFAAPDMAYKAYRGMLLFHKGLKLAGSATDFDSFTGMFSVDPLRAGAGSQQWHWNDVTFRAVASEGIERARSDTYQEFRLRYTAHASTAHRPNTEFTAIPLSKTLLV